jgi:hypothetical protein
LLTARTQILWAFSIWLESVAILPQLFMLQRTGEAETITTHYLFALGAYRALYIPNWIYRYFFEVPKFYDPIAVIAGIIQTILYSDFFYIYYTKYVIRNLMIQNTDRIAPGSSKARSSTCPSSSHAREECSVSAAGGRLGPVFCFMDQHSRLGGRF